MKVIKTLFNSSLLLFLLHISTALADTLVSECGISSSADNENLIIANDIQATVSPCITISHENVTLDCQGKQINGPDGGLHYGIRIQETGMNVAVLDCKLSNWFVGIYQAGDHGFIYNNTITYSGFGLVISSDGNVVRTNKIGYCSWDAFAMLNANENIFMDNGAFLNSNVRGLLLNQSHNNDIVDNRFGNNHTGIYLLDSHENNLIDNVSKGNWEAGIKLTESHDNFVADNVASKNDVGIEEFGEELNNIYDDNNCKNNYTADSNIEEACN
jgi:parallel beta-helix repeat protein